MSWQQLVVLVLLATAVGFGGVRVYRLMRPMATGAQVARKPRDGSNLPEELYGFQKRMVEWNGRFIRRVGLALIVLAGLLLLSLAFNVLQVAGQRQDDKDQAALSVANSVLIGRLNAVVRRQNDDLEDRKRRAAETDRQQCEDIERLKADRRASVRTGLKRIDGLSVLSATEKAQLRADAEANLRRSSPRTVTLPDGTVLTGVAACSALPNAKP